MNHLKSDPGVSLPATRQANVRLFYWLAAVALCGLCGFGYVVYRSLHTYVETYEQTTSPTLNGGKVGIAVSVHHRIKSDWGDSLVGPPYWFRIDIPDATDNATAGRLHSLQVIDSQGRALTVNITRGENKVTDGATSLYATVDRGDLGSRPKLIADIELVMPGGSVREEISLELRRGTSASLNFP